MTLDMGPPGGWARLGALGRTHRSSSGRRQRATGFSTDLTPCEAPSNDYAVALDRLQPDWREHLARAQSDSVQLVGVVTQTIFSGAPTPKLPVAPESYVNNASAMWLEVTS